jgi:citrate synthase
MSNDLHWKTAITEIKPNEVRLRGYRLDELMGRVSFGQAVYLALKGDLPSSEVGRLVEAILVSSIDHGATPPSTLAAITVASTGGALNAAVASGVLAINRFHGGAIEDCMGVLRQTVEKSSAREISITAAAEEIVSEYRTAGRRISGFGHRVHTKDPRSQRLFELAEEAGVSRTYVEAARAIEAALLSQTGKTLPINVDGAIAAVLCELDIPAELANGFFIMARTPGLIAHVHEEKSRYKPMRRIHPTDYEYDGPAPRSLSQEGKS